MKICLINGSLRGKVSSSQYFLDGLREELERCGHDVCSLQVKAVPPVLPMESLRQAAEADTLVLAFPLHAYCLPGAAMRLLEELGGVISALPGRMKTPRMYAVVNCAYHDPEINSEAIRVLKNFCRREGLLWRFAVSIGGGLVVRSTACLSFVKWGLRRAWRLVAADMKNPADTCCGDILIRPVIPKFVMMAVKDSRWAKSFMMKRKPKASP